MTDSPLLLAEAVSKRYRIRRERSMALGLLPKNRPVEHWALRSLDFAVHPGEVVAIIGRNGAGKSTLLKVAAGVTSPTTGKVTRPPRIAPLIEVGAGFHPELTGRENVEVNARLLGVGPRELAATFDEIVAFAELEQAIDQPVRQYSSGMFMRLGFSVAIHTRPQLLIVDEVLAVGDLPFQVRCLERITELRNQGAGVLFVSHNLTAVLNIADRGILLERGAVVVAGSVSEVVGAYHRTMADAGAASSIGDESGASGSLELEVVSVADQSGTEPTLWEPGQRAFVTLRLRALEATPEGVIGFRFLRDGAGQVALWVAEDGPFIPAMQPGECHDLTLSFDLNFAEGGCLLDVSVANHGYTSFMLVRTGVLRFGIGHRRGATGIIDLAPSLEPPAPA